MTDTQSTLERELERLSPPRIPFDELTRRRDRRRRDQRIRAGALGIAVLIALGWWGLNAIRSAPVPADHPTPSPAPSKDLGIFTPVAGRIVYGNRLGIWGIDPTAPTDPAATVRLTSEPDEPLAWSSDGTGLLVLRGQYLFVLHADGSETQVTTDPMNIEGATISPDGSRVVFAGGTEGPGLGRYALYAVDADGGPVEMLVESQMGVVRTPTFSPDGTQIAYVDDDSDVRHGVWLMNADGSDVHQIVPDPGTGHVTGLAWSPAGDRIALGFEQSIYTFAPDGSDFTQALTGAEAPYWSPDGSRLAYRIACIEHADGCGLAIADADGSNAREFGFGDPGPWHPAPTPSDDSTATASPPEPRRDGEILVFQELGTGPGLDIAAADPETGDVRKIVETDGIVDCPEPSHCVNFIRRAQWSSDGRWVAFEVASAPDGPCGPTDGLWVQGPAGYPWQLTAPCMATPGARGIEELWAWSPEGARLASSRVDGEDDGLFVIDPTDGSRTLRLQNGGNRTALEWSPDGTRIAVASEGEGVFEVSVDPGPGAGLWELVASFEDVVDIDYSPDGTQMMVLDRGGDRLRVMTPEGYGVHVLVDGQEACCAPTWSPDGNRIVYQLSVDNGASSLDSEVWTVEPDGSNPIKVFDSNGCDMGATDAPLPVWASNGTQVAYNACGGWVVANADGTGEPQPIDQLVYEGWPGGGLGQG